MTTNEYCKTILRDVPEYISSDQMYRICHISKRTCLYLLEAKLVPNIDSGKKTRRFKIKTKDVVSYLKDRETNPEKYKPPKNYYKVRKKAKPKYPFGRPLTTGDFKTMRSFLKMRADQYPDVLTVAQVSQFTGYSNSSVALWCRKKLLKSFFIKGKYFVPKEYLLDFLTGPYFMRISVKSQQHSAYNDEIQSILTTNS